MENEIVTTDDQLAQLLATRNQDTKTLEAISTSASYLPRLQVNGSSTDLVKQGLLQMATYGLVKSKTEFTQLGKEILASVITFRAKALDMSNPANIISVYDHLDAEFKRIQKQAGVKDSMCSSGPEFLLWLPDEKKFCTFLCGSKTSQRQIPMFRKCMDEKTLALMSVDYIAPTGSKFTWHGPKVVPSSAPISNAPDPELMKTTIVDFLNPPTKTVEKDTEPARPR